MKSIYELIKETPASFYLLTKSRFNRLDDLLEDACECYRVIEKCLDVRTKFKPAFNEQRARHVVLTFLLGECFGVFDGLFDDLNQLGVINNEYLWLYTSLAHDYGYFCSEIKSDAELDSFEKEYPLFSDQIHSTKFEIIKDFSARYPSYFTYTYEQIRSYYEYARDFHKNDACEKIDHGIVGACLVFHQVCAYWDKCGYDRSIRRGVLIIGDRVINEQYDLLMYKAACIAVASHNIFKSQSPKTDAKYKRFNLSFLSSDSAFRIERTNALLLLMALVDTIECTKRFDVGNNENFVLNPIRILQSIRAEVSKKKIRLNFADLVRLKEQRWDEEKYVSQIKRHVNAVKSLESWTCVKTERPDDYVVEIHL